jgi:lysophospholipase L1-like esterase
MGDSFTEGLDDPAPAGHYRGWADRFAEHLAAGGTDLRYANLAIRGKLLREIVEQQLPVAVQARPELVTLAGGGNDLLRPGASLGALMALFDRALGELRDAGCEVVLFGAADPGNRPVLRRLRTRLVGFNERLHAVAARHECTVIDLWRLPALADVRAWSADRLHLSAEGHRRVALYVCSRLGVEAGDDWRTPWPPAPPVPWWTQRYDDARWARDHLVPWVTRRLRGRSSGDDLQAKRPGLHPL